jgi:uncharacterized protein DUF6594
VSQIQQLKPASTTEFNALRELMEKVEDTMPLGWKRNFRVKNDIEANNGEIQTTEDSSIPHFAGIERRVWSNGFDLVSINPRDRPTRLEIVLLKALTSLRNGIKEMLFCCLNCRWSPSPVRKEKNETKDKTPEELTEVNLEEEKGASDFFTHRKGIHRFLGITYNAFAASLPGICVLILYHLHNILHRIYMLIGLAVSFAIIVKFMNPSRDVEIFSVSAA